MMQAFLHMPSLTWTDKRTIVFCGNKKFFGRNPFGPLRQRI